MNDVVDGQVVDEIESAMRVRINAEDPATGEYVFVCVSPETAENLIAALQDSMRGH